MTLRRHEYQDPCIVLEQKQNATCLGCSELIRSRWSNETKFICNKAMQKAGLNVYEMKRCKKYTEGK